MKKLTYKDTYGINDRTFRTKQELMEKSIRNIEVAGEVIYESDEAIYVASVVNGSTFGKVLYIPKDCSTEIFEFDDTAYCLFKEVQSIGYSRNYSLEELLIRGAPPKVEYYGFLVGEDDEKIILATEKNADGEFRMINILPKGANYEK